jgi:hypothetical protein
VLPAPCSGNLTLSATTSFALAEVLVLPDNIEPKHLLPVATGLAGSVAELSPQWLASRLQYLDSFADPGAAFADKSPFGNKAVVAITPWEYLGADCVWGVPGTGVDGKASALRKPGFKCEGTVKTQARRRGEDRDYKSLVCPEEGEMNRLIQGLERWVGKVVEG